MSRYSSSGSYGHKVQYISYMGGCYRISWTVDFYYSDTRGRFPRKFSRDTDEKGARKFCKKWGIDFEKANP